MHLTVFGASGGIGTHAVAFAAQRGHQVRAIYRTAPSTPPPGRAEVLLAPDIFDPAFAAAAIRGAYVVVSAVGPNFTTHHNPRTTMTSPPDLHQRLARTLVTVMKDSLAPSRLIAVFQPHTPKAKARSKKLMADGRVNFIAPADYSAGKAIDKIVRAKIEQVAAAVRLSQQTR